MYRRLSVMNGLRKQAVPMFIVLLFMAFASHHAVAADKKSGHKHGGRHAAGGHSLLKQCQGSSAMPAPDCGRAPTAAFDIFGRLWVVFSQHGHIYLGSSDDLGKTFSAPMAVNRVPEKIYDDGENRPKLVFGPRGEMFVSWVHKTPAKYSGDIRFTRSLNGGRSFDEPLTVNDDGLLTSHRFDAMGVDSQGRVYIAWLDKRDLVAAKQAGIEYAGAALYYAVSENRGESFAFNRKVVDHSCECCRTAMAMDSRDRAVVLWRHVYPVNMRDHAIARLSVDSSSLEGMPPRATDDGWQVEGCPHHGPSITMDSDDRAHLLWFSQGTKNQGLSYGRMNLDSGVMEVQHSMDKRPGAGHAWIESAEGKLYALWKAFTGQHTELLLSVSADSGETWSSPQAVAHTMDGSDHPLLVRKGELLFASWQTRAEGYRLLPVSEIQH